MRWAATTHVGEVRAVNQDAILSGPTVFAIADGMGGHAAGEVASALTINALSGLGEPLTEAALVSAIVAANQRVLDEAAPGTGREGMGTTVVGLARVTERSDDLLVVFNVGDSRAYRCSGGRLVRVTQDHSLVEEMIRAGELAAEDAHQHPLRNVVTRVIGGDAVLEIDRWTVTPEAGDRFLLCSDGLTNEIDESAIEAALKDAGDPQLAVDRLLAAALGAGGRDNISIVVVDVDTVQEASALTGDTSPRTARDPSPTALITQVPSFGNGQG